MGGLTTMARRAAGPVAEGEDRRNELAPGLAVGRIMPCHAFTDQVLLLACGERIVSESQIERLLRADVVFSNDPPPHFAQAIEERQRELGIWRAPLEKTQDREKDLAASSGDPVETGPSSIEPATPFVVELVAARRLRREAMGQVAELVEQARRGETISLRSVRGTVRQVVHSLRRNHRVFSSLLRLKTLDSYTYTHSINNCVISVILAQGGGFADQAEEIGLGGLMHDIGKVRLPEGVLQKPESLTDYEWSMVKQHPVVGLEIVRQGDEVRESEAEAISQHHERLDGSGYPASLREAAIAPAGRMVAIADVYDAMTSERPYHKAIPAPEAMRWILQRAGELFDPHLVRTFVDSIGLFPVGSLVRLSSGELAVVADVNPAAIRRPRVLIVSEFGGVPTGELRLLDLAQPAVASAGREIVGVEDAACFDIDIEECLEAAPALAEPGDPGLDSFA